MKKYGIGLLSMAILIASFLICRFALFDMHKMKQFPLVLLIAGGLFIGISMLFGCSRFPLFASLGYPVSFAAGLIFRQDYADPTGAMTLNNMWIICIIVYLVIVCIGIVVEAIARKKRKG